jgi:hypothetical protein
VSSTECFVGTRATKHSRAGMARMCISSYKTG